MYMRCLLAALLGTAASAVFAGCAGYKIEEGGRGCGYDVYRPEPYLKATPKVSTGEEGGSVVTYEFTVVWLPNYGKRYRVSSWAGFGKADFSFTFQDGWMLTKVDDKSDNTEVLKALTSLAQHVLPADPFGIGAKKLGPEGMAKVEPPQPIFYRIDFDEAGRPACLKRLQVEALPCPPAAQASAPCATR